VDFELGVKSRVMDTESGDNEKDELAMLNEKKCEED